ncbi:hypothetical protein Agub_g3754, partial [Astrephomene gubernaculifera]
GNQAAQEDGKQQEQQHGELQGGEQQQQLQVPGGVGERLLLEGLRVFISVGTSLREDVGSLARALGACVLTRLPAAPCPAAPLPSQQPLKTARTLPPADLILALGMTSARQPSSSSPSVVPTTDNGESAAPLFVLLDPDMAAASGGAAARQFSALSATAAALGAPLVSYKWLMECAGGYRLVPYTSYIVTRR